MLYKDLAIAIGTNNTQYTVVNLYEELSDSSLKYIQTDIVSNDIASSISPDYTNYTVTSIRLYGDHHMNVSLKYIDSDPTSELRARAKKLLDKFVYSYELTINRHTPNHIITSGYHRYIAMTDMVEYLGLMDYNEAQLYREVFEDMYTKAFNGGIDDE